MKLAWRVTMGGLALATLVAMGAFPFGELDTSPPPEVTTLETITFPATEMVVDPLDTPLLRRFLRKYGAEVATNSKDYFGSDARNQDGRLDGDIGHEWNKAGCTTDIPMAGDKQDSKVSAEEAAPLEDIFLFPPDLDNVRPKVASQEGLMDVNAPLLNKASLETLTRSSPTAVESQHATMAQNRTALFNAVPTSRPIIRLASTIREKSSAANHKTTTLASRRASVSKVVDGSASAPLPTVHPDRRCRLTGIVTVQDGGRLGNKLWEYAAVWALGHALKLRPLVPLTLIRYLKRYFKDLSVGVLEDAIPPGCPKKPEALGKPMKRWRLFPLDTLKKRLNLSAGENLVLHRWIILPEPVIALRGKQLRKEFRFHQKYVYEARKTLKWVVDEVNSRRNKDNCTITKITFVGIHVRRTDFAQWLPRVYNKSMATASYFHQAMDHFRKKIKGPIAFVVASDDPLWVKINLGARAINTSHIQVTGKNDVFLGTKEGDRTYEGIGHDLALLSLCNHSIIDYGTFGAWGALMAGGNTISLHSDQHLDTQLASTIPGWMIWDDPGIKQKIP